MCICPRVYRVPTYVCRSIFTYIYIHTYIQYIGMYAYIYNYNILYYIILYCIYGCMCCVYITYLYVQLHVCVPVYVYVEYTMRTCNTVKLSRCMMAGICKYVCVEVFTYGSRMHMPYFCLCFKFWLHVYFILLLCMSNVCCCHCTRTPATVWMAVPNFFQPLWMFCPVLIQCLNPDHSRKQ